MESAERRKLIPEMLDLVGLDQWGAVRIGKYSKGMLQRLGLAQALIHSPSMLILDEPTDGVDPVGRRQIRDVLTRCEEKGVTIFINSHLLAEVETFCREVAILHKGKVALSGKMADLTAGKGYRLTVADAPEAVLEELRGKAISMAFPKRIRRFPVRKPAGSERGGGFTADATLRDRGAGADHQHSRRSVCSDGGKVKDSLTATKALIVDTFREAFARKIFWGLFGLSTAMILFFLFLLRIDLVEGGLAAVSAFGRINTRGTQTNWCAACMAVSRPSCIRGECFWPCSRPPD